jgi:hypothetical protein
MRSTPDLKPASPHVTVDLHSAAALLPGMEATNAGVSNCEVAE